MGWAENEMETVNLGDRRLNNRAVEVLNSMSDDPNASIPKAFQGWHDTKAAYRFFDNSKVTQQQILQPHLDKTVDRIKQENRVLLIQDTTELDYNGQQQKQGVGPSRKTHEKKLFFHPMLATTTEKVALGLINIHTWHREELLSKKHTHKVLNNRRLHSQDISEKESFRWLLGYRQATKIARECQGTHIIMVADRESDIADLYNEAEETELQKADWIVRAKTQNRAIMSSDGTKDSLLLKQKLLQTTPVGIVEFELPRRTGKKSRPVKQTIRTIRVQAHPPTGRRGSLRLKPFWITAVLAQEENPPEGEEAIEWLLLTSINLNEEVKFHHIIQWYLCRWQIEVFFYILKSGCKVEDLQLTCPERYLPCLAMYSIIAWRILMLKHLARVTPNASCEVVFTVEEWQCAYLVIHKAAPPDVAPNLKSMLRDIAKLGGFLGRKSDGDPGPKTIWLGLKKVREFITAIEQHKKINKFTDKDRRQ